MRKLISNDYRPSAVRNRVSSSSTTRVYFICTETPAREGSILFIRKLNQRKVLSDSNDARAELGGKKMKAQTLHEMLDYINTQRNLIAESIYPEVVNMVSLDHSPWLTLVKHRQLPVCNEPLPINSITSKHLRRSIRSRGR